MSCSRVPRTEYDASALSCSRACLTACRSCGDRPDEADTGMPSVEDTSSMTTCGRRRPNHARPSPTTTSPAAISVSTATTVLVTVPAAEARSNATSGRPLGLAALIPPSVDLDRLPAGIHRRAEYHGHLLLRPLPPFLVTA